MRSARSRFTDISGQKFNRLTAVRFVEGRRNGARFLCRCDCGTELVVRSTALKTGNTKSCGCLHREVVSIPKNDLAGKRMGRFRVIKRSTEILDDHGVYWECECTCGTKRTVLGSNLVNGKSTSCGCYHREILGQAGKTHGMSESPEYCIWKQIKQRCHNPKNVKYPDYGGRGIAVTFGSFQDFYAEIGPRPTPLYEVDRKDNSKGYEPGNIQWATRGSQMRNTRVNFLLTYRGKSLTMIEWSERTGISLTAIRGRVRLGWSVKKTLTMPVQGRLMPNKT